MAGSTLSWQTATSASWVDSQIATGKAAPSVDAPDLYALEIETLYAIRRPELIRFLIRFGVDAAEAEDIAQESFLRAFREAKRGKHPDNLPAWVTTCAKNLAIDRMHKSRREMLVSSSLWEEWKKQLPTPGTTLEGRFYEMERKLWLLEALASLEAGERQCMVLRSEGATFREIAMSLEIPLRHAVYLTSKAVQRLRSGLKDISS